MTTVARVVASALVTVALIVDSSSATVISSSQLFGAYRKHSGGSSLSRSCSDQFYIRCALNKLHELYLLTCSLAAPWWALLCYFMIIPKYTSRHQLFIVQQSAYTVDNTTAAIALQCTLLQLSTRDEHSLSCTLTHSSIVVALQSFIKVMADIAHSSKGKSITTQISALKR
eukprot:2984-Heterococcus_DN1.PRE.2